MEQNDSNENNSWWWNLLVIIVFIILCILIIPSLFIQQTQENAEKKKDLESLKEKLKNLEHKILLTKQRRESLDAKFQNRYLIARVIVAALWISVQALYFINHGYLNGISHALEFNGYCLSLLIAANFVLFGKFTDIKEMIQRFEMWLRNYIYRNDKTIHEDLLAYDNEKNEVVSKIDLLKHEIENLEQNRTNNL